MGDGAAVPAGQAKQIVSGAMASANITVSLSLEWAEVEPDDSECIECGERCYLGQRELVANAEGGRTMWRSGYFKCVACAE